MEQQGYDIAIFLTPIILSLLISVGLGFVTFIWRQVPGGRSFTIILLLEASWTLGYILELFSPTLQGKIFWDNFQYIGSFLLPVAMLAFTFEYCKVKTHYIRPVWLGFLIPAVIGIVLVYTNTSHHLAILNPHLIQDYPFDVYTYSNGNPIYFIYLYGYGLLFWAIYLLINLFFRQKDIYRLQTGIVLTGLLVCVFGSLFSFIDLPFLAQHDLSPYYFTISNICIAYGLFRLKVFDIVLVGRSLVVENMNDGVLIVDSSGHLIDINGAARDLIGQTDLIAIGQPINSLPSRWADHLMDTDPDSTHLKEFVLPDKQGDRYFELTSTQIITRQGQFSGHMLMLRDVSTRKKTELALQAAFNEMEQRVTERTLELSKTIIKLKGEIHERLVAETALLNSESSFQSIIEQSSEGFMLVDEDAHILEANLALEEITGIHQYEMLGQYVWDFQAKLTTTEDVSPEMADRFRNSFVNALHNPDAPIFKRPFEVEIITPRGEKKVIQQVTFPVIKGSTMRLGTFIRDITRQKQAEAELQALNNELEERVAERTEQLENINQELESFSYSVSHDLRAPLRSIGGFANILLEDAVDVLSQDQRGYLDRILGNIKHMNKLINALLDLSRLGRKPLECQQVNTSQIIHSAWDEVWGEAGERNIQFTIDEPPDCTADPILLKQVYINLLSNAIKYTRLKPEAVIQVGWERQDNATVYWVKDNGAGFDMQYADKLFGIFQRLHREDQFEGSGVGLTTVQRIIHRHGGRIWAEAHPDQGAIFYFTLSKQ